MQPPTQAQQRLFRAAVSAFCVSGHYVAGEGWSLSVTARREDESWTQAYTRSYDHLTTDELEQVLEDTSIVLNPSLA